MGGAYNQRPDDIRGRAGKALGGVPEVRDKSNDDPDWENQLYEGAGYGVHAYAVAARKKRKARSDGWTSTADKQEGAGNIGHGSATEMEHVDGQGGAGVKRVFPEV